jgi:CBS domain-containing protein
MVWLCTMKLISWMISLGSGTSGGTLAPLFTIGGGLGGVIGVGAAAILPSFGVDPRIAALVGMASIFAGASRALLASVVFAFEATRQPMGLLPLLGGCSAAYLISCLAMRNTIMTEKIARRGVHVAGEYIADFLSTRPVRAHMTTEVVTLAADDLLGTARGFLAGATAGARHQGFPVVENDGKIIGVVTRRDLMDVANVDGKKMRDIVRRPPIVLRENSSLRDAVTRMARGGVGRLPVVDDDGKLIGIVSRSDVLAAESRRLKEEAAASGGKKRKTAA